MTEEKMDINVVISRVQNVDGILILINNDLDEKLTSYERLLQEIGERCDNMKEGDEE